MSGTSKFYSGALQAAETLANSMKDKPLPLKKLRELLTAKGAKGTELKYIGFDDLVKSAPDGGMTPLSAAEWIDEHKYLPIETLLTREGPLSTDIISKAERHLNRENVGMIFGVSPEELYTGLGDVGRRRLNDLNEGYFSPFGYIEMMTRHPRQGMIPYKESSDYTTQQIKRLNDLMDYYLTQGGRKDFGQGKVKYMGYSGNKADVFEKGDVSPDYREILVKDQNSDWNAPHFDNFGEGLIGHVRVDPRPDTFRLEEVQSDLHQNGRQHGYRPQNFDEELQRLRNIYSQSATELSNNTELLAPYNRINEILDSYYHMRWNEDLANHSIEYTGSPETQQMMRRLEQMLDRDRYQELLDERVRLQNLNYRASNEYETFSEKGRLPPALPLSETSDWTAMLARRALLEAANFDSPSITIPSGDVYALRYWNSLIDPSVGAYGYHEKTLPDVVNKLLRAYGNEEPLVKKMGPPYPYLDRYEHKKYVSPEWFAPLSDKMKETLRKVGKVPFFKEGGEVR